MALSKKLREKYEKRFYGRKMEVLYEDFDSKSGLSYGHTSNYLLVKVPSPKARHGELEAVVYDEKTAAD